MINFGNPLKKLALFALVASAFSAPIVAQQAAPATGNTPAAKSQTAKKSGGRATKKAPLSGRINLNTASVQELMRLPRVGEKVALRIVEYRQKHGGFKKSEELMNVKGIGEKTFDKMKDNLSI